MSMFKDPSINKKQQFLQELDEKVKRKADGLDLTQTHPSNGLFW